MPPASAGPSDQELIQRVARGESDALLLLYQRHGSAVYALAHYVLRDAALAEETTQEIFLSVWLKAGQYRSEYALVRTWLLSITRHRAIDVLRHRRRTDHANVSLDELMETDERALAVNDPQLEGGELHLLLRQLPPEQRTAIELAYWSGFTHQEIAERLKLPVGTVKSRILLGLRKLRDMLREGESASDRIARR